MKTGNVVALVLVRGGRPRYLATPISGAELQRYIRLLAQHGIAFNHLLLALGAGFSAFAALAEFPSV
jgi:hypothetical protein